MNKYERKPEYVLDLHGFTTKEARSLLEELLKGGVHNHVRIITGKGVFRETGPVMRSFVQGYLREHGIVFETAKLQDGGEGALEAYLKGKE